MISLAWVFKILEKLRDENQRSLVLLSRTIDQSYLLTCSKLTLLITRSINSATNRMPPEALGPATAQNDDDDDERAVIGPLDDPT